MSTRQIQRLISKPTLAVIKDALADLCTHSQMGNVFEQYDFECGPNTDYSNKVQRAGSHLDHQDWTKPDVLQRLLGMLVHLFLQRKSSLVYGGGLETIPSCQKIIKVLGEREAIDWNGEQFVSRKSASLLHVAEKVQAFNQDSVHREMQRLLANVDTDPDDVLTSAKCLIESVCRAILADVGEPPSSNAPEFGQLTKQTLGQLRLLPDQVSSKGKGTEVIKRILQNMGSVLQNLAELRNIYGDAHGKAPGTKGLEPRHARLAAGLAGSLAIFLMETYEQRRTTNSAAAGTPGTQKKPS